MKKVVSLCLAFGFMCSFHACMNGGEKQNEFDRTEFLEHYATQIIQPAFDKLATQSQAFESAVQAFEQKPEQANLVAMQNSWTSLYENWIEAGSFCFGPAGSNGLIRPLYEEIGMFPADIEGVEAKIAAGDFDVEDAQRATRGLLAIEYLLFKENALTDFDADRIKYLIAITSKVKERTEVILAAWKAGYATEFVANDGTSTKSGATMMYNELVRSFETMKEMKLGMPIGLVADESNVHLPVEAPYSQQSLKFLELQFETIVSLWYGQTAEGTNGIGWDDYLVSVEGGDQLMLSTEEQIEAIRKAFDTLPADKNMQELIDEKDERLRSLFYRMHELTRYLKGDMSSLLGLAITFSSSDGD